MTIIKRLLSPKPCLVITIGGLTVNEEEPFCWTDKGPAAWRIPQNTPMPHALSVLASSTGREAEDTSSESLPSICIISVSADGRGRVI